VFLPLRSQVFRKGSSSTGILILGFSLKKRDLEKGNDNPLKLQQNLVFG
jgi:hypothetical protein